MKGPQEYISNQFEQLLNELRPKDLRPCIYYHKSQQMNELEGGSVQLVVTSPPYPMIEMWDASFEQQLELPKDSFKTNPRSFELAHDLLGVVWAECYRLLEEGGLMCVNIGDATRTILGNFRCYMNHSRVIENCEKLGFQSLVPILWKKPTNKPNAFLGSGFIPPNAYVTLDCEYLLIFRKGQKRILRSQNPLRYASEYSKAERDSWFTQIWEIRGATQNHEITARFPEEIPYRLIRMFSCIGDAVLDPFAGTGQTIKVARFLGRRGIGYELNAELAPIIEQNVNLQPLDPRAVLENILRLYERQAPINHFAVADFVDAKLSAFQ